MSIIPQIPKKVYDIIVVGAGAAGLPLCYSLAKKGLDVLCLEKNASAGAGDGKTAIGGFRATHASPAKVQLGMKALEVISTWKEVHGDDIEWQKGGYVFTAFGDAEEKKLAGLVPMHRSYDMKSEFIDTEAMTKLVPGINTKGLNGGLYTSEDGNASPMLVMHAYHRVAKEAGCKFVYHETVEKVNEVGGKVTGVTTRHNGDISAPIVVDCAGKFSVDLFKDFAYCPPVKPDMHEALITEPVRPMGLNGRNLPMVVCTTPQAATETTPGSSNFYFYQNLHGQIIGCITPNPLIPGTGREETSAFLPQIAKRMIDLIPSLSNIRVRRTWRGIYPMSADGSPTIGWNPNVEGLFHNTCWAGQGLMIPPGASPHIANVINNEIGDLELCMLDEFKVDRDMSGATEALK